jgi:murein DD-endopeptidase MepM/ murein hydrolase activator NlpD
MHQLDPAPHEKLAPRNPLDRPLSSRLGSLLLSLLSLGLLPSGISEATEITSAASDLEIRIAPADYLIANKARVVGIGYEGTSPYYDLVLQAIYFINRGEAPLTLEAGSIEVMAGTEVLQTTAIAPAEMQRAQTKAAAIAAMEFPVALDIYYSAASLLPDGIAFSPELTLAPGTSGLVDDAYLVVRSLPDQVRVSATARHEDGRQIRAVAALPVREHESTNSYIFPLEPGEWFIQAFPGIGSHHRWSAATEHALDITMVDARGSWARGDAAAWRTGKVPRWEDWYAYDKKVLAAADGVVVKVVDDVEFPLEFWNCREGESQEEYLARIGKRQMELFLAPEADAMAVAGGNHIVIEHEGGEYSFYAHLAHGTIRVREGDRVTQGQHIAGLGGTGEAPAVHLHFQITDRASMIGARTLPVEFTNVAVNEQFVDAYAPEMVSQPGFFIATTESAPPPASTP